MNGKELKSVGDTVIILLARMPNLMRIENSRKVQTWQSLDECPWQTTNDCFSLFIHHGLVYVQQNRNSLRWNRYLFKLEPIQVPKKRIVDTSNDWGFSRIDTRWGESQQTGDQPRSGCWLRTSWYSLYGTIQQSSFENAVLHTYEPIPIYLDLKMRWELMDGRR